MKQKYHVVCFGESLWDILPSGKQIGGAPLNVAYHLKKLGKNPAIISRVGFDEHGRQLIEMLERNGVATELFQMDYEKPTGVVTGQLKSDHEMSYTIAEDVAWDHIALDPSAISIVEQSDYFVYGSLAARSRLSAGTLASLLEAAPRKVFDINLRAPYYNRSALESLIVSADMLKLSAEELELITGWYSPYRTIKDRISAVRDRFQTEMIIVTRGGDGAIIHCEDQWYACDGLKVQVADTVGCGDSFLAALLAFRIDDAPIEVALHQANELAAFISTQQGACPEYDAATILQSPQNNQTFSNTQHPSN